jgi:transposase
VAGWLLVQVDGRSAASVIDWLGERDQVWRESITHVAVDMSVTYARAVRDALPHAQLIVDRFHHGQTGQPDGRGGPATHHLGQPGSLWPQG